MKWLLLISLSLFGCMDDKSPNIYEAPTYDGPKVPTEELYMPFIEAFELKFGIPVDVPIITSSGLNPTSIAVCDKIHQPYPLIQFNQTWVNRITKRWKAGSKSYNLWFQRLVEHELGHCLFGLKHTNDVGIFEQDITTSQVDEKKGIEKIYRPMSIMYPYFIPEEFYSKNEEYYRAQLIGEELSEAPLKTKTFASFETAAKFVGSYPHYDQLGEYSIYDTETGKLILRTDQYSEYLEGIGFFIQKDVTEKEMSEVAFCGNED